MKKVLCDSILEVERHLLIDLLSFSEAAWKEKTRYSREQIYELVINRRRSFGHTGGDLPLYLWGEIVFDEEPALVWDLGKMSHVGGYKDIEYFGNKKRKWFNYQYNIAMDIQEFDSWDLIYGINSFIGSYGKLTFDVCLEEGWTVGTKILLRATGDWYKCSYEYDEYDISWESEVVFVEKPELTDKKLNQLIGNYCQDLLVKLTSDSPKGIYGP